ncbi:alcohol dehydrogenase catalytic domain-containing protein [Nitrospira sp. Nam74]
MKPPAFDHFDDFSALQYADVPDPTPGSDEVVVDIHATSLSPGDSKNVQGRMVGTTLPRTPGRDFDGVVMTGPMHLLGQEVWGSGSDIGFTRDGSHAEKIVVPIAGVRPKPNTLTMAEAFSAGVTVLGTKVWHL